MEYRYNAGDLVSAPSASGGRRPALVIKVVNSDLLVEFVAKSKGRRQVKAAEVKVCTDFDWCAGIELDVLVVGDAVEARHMHGDGGAKWYAGKVSKVMNETFDIRSSVRPVALDSSDCVCLLYVQA